MINSVARGIMEIFEPEVFVETGILDGETARIVRKWFKHLPLFEVDVEEACCAKVRRLLNGDPNATVVHSDSVKFLRDNLAEFAKKQNPFFYLDAHWGGPPPDTASDVAPDRAHTVWNRGAKARNSYWPLRDEIAVLRELDKCILAIDDFKTPGRFYQFDRCGGNECSLEYIRDLIQDRTDCVFHAANCNVDGVGCGFMFLGYHELQLDPLLARLPLIKQPLRKVGPRSDLGAAMPEPSGELIAR